MDKAKRVDDFHDEFVVIPPLHAAVREAGLHQVAQSPKAARSCTPSAARVMSRRGEIADGYIAPNGDGFGGYLVWLRSVHPDASAWYYLSHEDGAPLRFPDAVTAQSKAMDCALREAQISVRWPPQ